MDHVTWPWKVKLVTPIRLERTIVDVTWPFDTPYVISYLVPGTLERSLYSHPAVFTEHKNDKFSCKQHIVLWINNVKQYFLFTHKFLFQSKYLSDRLIYCSKCGSISLWEISLKENPKSGYDWSATGQWQWQTAFCMCQREHWECGRPCAQSGRQSKNAPIESWDLMWNRHSLTDCTQNCVYWLCQKLLQSDTYC